MTNRDPFLNKYNLSGPEEFCNTIARMDWHLRDVMNRLEQAVSTVRAIEVTDEHYCNNDEIKFLWNRTMALLKTARIDLNRAANHGMDRDPSDKLYHFLLTGAIGFDSGSLYAGKHGFDGGGRYTSWADDTPRSAYQHTYESICETNMLLTSFGRALQDQILDEDLTDEVIDQHIADMEASLM